MVSWYADGGVSFFRDGSGDLVSPTILDFTTPGSVDSETVTRAQYQKFPTTYDLDTLRATANLTYTVGDVSDNPGSRLTATMFVAAASLFPTGDTPTPEEILAKGGQLEVFRSTQYRTTAGSQEFKINGMRANLLSPGVKYWVLILPTAVPNWSSNPSVSHDHVATGGAGNTIGRAISLWTNRPPIKPVLTSPAGDLIKNPGEDFTLSFDSATDADYIFDASLSYSWDICGVQIQRAAVTGTGEALVWQDIDFLDVAGDPHPAWWIYGSTLNMVLGGTEQFLLTATCVIECDPPTPTDGTGQLPAGDWLIRMRTFDPGGAISGPYSAGFTVGAYDPDNYPVYNTSSWTEPFRVTILAQVPPPIPLSPINSIALAEGSDATLRWRYRNTALPTPFTQAERVVEIREPGEPTWTTLVDEVSSSNELLVTGYPLEAGTEYEWHVKVTDTDSVESSYSDTLKSRFWIVPAPGSGDVRPVPSDTVDEATLGCGTHRAFIYRRGGVDRIGEIRNISYLDWARVRDDISTSKVVISGWDVDCGNLLALLQCWAYELVIFRDNGFTVDRVWEGPITLLTYERNSVTIDAKDVMGYAYRRIIKQAMNDTGTSDYAGSTVVNRAMRIIQTAFASNDPNILAYLQVLARDDDAKQYRNTPPYARTAFEEIDDMASNQGLDYTAVGRSIILWGTKHRIGTLPEFRDEDLGSPPIVSEYGMSFANRYVVSDGNGVYGEATRLDVSGNDEVYGLVEMLSSSWASDSPDEIGSFGEEAIETTRESFKESAERSIADRYPPPVVVRVPDNTTLNPGTVLSIQQLVPGVAIPLRSTGTLRSVVATQKLDSVTVVEEGGTEKISVVLSPFSRDDVEIVKDD